MMRKAAGTSVYPLPSSSPSPSPFPKTRPRPSTGTVTRLGAVLYSTVLHLRTNTQDVRPCW